MIIISRFFASISHLVTTLDSLLTRSQREKGRSHKKVCQPDLRKERIYSSITELMIEKKLFKDSGLNRKSLASNVGTNSKYLSDAVKEFGNGRTVNELINWWRLQEASRILYEDAKMPVAVVGEESGFGSSQTFYRLFKEYYGMTPSDFRKLASKTIS